MSYIDDFEDVGGYYADQDFFVSECEEYEGNCRKCPYEYECDASDYTKRRGDKWHGIVAKAI